MRTWVGDQLSPIAKPDEIRFTENLPKTRSGKIMRRLLRSIARGEQITQDVSTLENPNILEMLRGLPGSSPAKKAAARKAAPRKSVVKAAAPLAKTRAAKAGPKAKPKSKAKRKAQRAAPPRAKRNAKRTRPKAAARRKK